MPKRRRITISDYEDNEPREPRNRRGDNSGIRKVILLIGIGMIIFEVYGTTKQCDRTQSQPRYAIPQR